MSTQGATCVRDAATQLGPKLARTPASPREGRDPLRSYLGTFQLKLYSFKGIACIQLLHVIKEWEPKAWGQEAGVPLSALAVELLHDLG